MLSDLNFDRNRADTLWQNRSRTIVESLERGVKVAFARGLPTLGVRGLEAFGISCRFREFLPHPPSTLCRRSMRREWCLSPWQTLPVDVEGNTTICDCRPGETTGNMLRDPFSHIWNGNSLLTWRRLMIGHSPPRTCLDCPRF
jgi:MoaA/NifB/PqqE/SkfB family radical SAM enzyme